MSFDPEPQRFDPDAAPVIAEGIHVYVGTTGTGKTFKALHDLEALHDSTADRGALIVDSVGSPTLREIEQVPDLRTGIERVWGEGDIVRWIPSDEGENDAQADFRRLMKALLAGGNVRVLIDEISFWARNPEMLKLARVWRNANTTLLLTGQHLSADFGQSILSCNPTVYVFRLSAPAGIEFAVRWLRISEEENAALGMGEFIERRF